jgi:hypothetical protein
MVQVMGGLAKDLLGGGSVENLDQWVDILLEYSPICSYERVWRMEVAEGMCNRTVIE